MYERGTFHGPLGSAIADHADCPSQSPDYVFICTLNKGHDGLHIGGVDLSTWCGQWDDNRSTDPATADEFFAVLGL